MQLITTPPDSSDWGPYPTREVLRALRDWRGFLSAAQDVARDLFVFFEVASLAVAEGQADAEGHEAERGDEQDDDALADRALALFGSRSSSAVAHGAGLAQGGGRGQHKRDHEKRAAPG